MYSIVHRNKIDSKPFLKFIKKESKCTIFAFWSPIFQNFKIICMIYSNNRIFFLADRIEWEPAI